MGTRSTKPWYQRYIEARISEVWGWCPERKKAKARAQISRIPELYECEECGRVDLTRRQVEIDHLVPRKNVKGWDGYDKLIARTFVEAAMLQIVCKDCHTKKSVGENAERRKSKDGRTT